jgi:hypothetical protein
MRLKWWSRKSRADDEPVPPPGKSERPAGGAQATARRYTHLPERVDPKQMVTSKRADPARDPEGGRDTERDFLLRHGAGGDDAPWDPTDG